jgi:dTDP-4-amino-4,6-dideoxygalactose transaminase
MIPYGKQFIDKIDIRNVSRALNSKVITGGKYKEKLEKKFCDYFKVKYSVTCNSGTSALQLAIESINLKKNDVVIMPAINFVAAYNVCKKIGAKIFFSDVDPLTGQMTENKFNECVNFYKIKSIKLIITMYLGGYPEYIDKFYKIKKKYNCVLLEDACHALGAKYNYKKIKYKIGSCKHSDLSVFSLHPLKTITSGEGGVVTTNNKSFFKSMNLLKSHGIVRDKVRHWKYDVIKNGYNYRLSDINCALALSQLPKIGKFIKARASIFKFYKKNFYKIEKYFNINHINNQNLPSFHLIVFSIKNNILDLKKDKLLNFLLKNNIISQYHYIPIYNFKVYSGKINKALYQGAEKFYRNSFSLPIFYGLKKKQIIKILDTLKTFVKVYI